jgi:hypothetical protein
MKVSYTISLKAVEENLITESYHVVNTTNSWRHDLKIMRIDKERRSEMVAFFYKYCMRVSNFRKHFKSTLLGFALIGIAVSIIVISLLKGNEINYMFNGGLVATGIWAILSPDTLIEKLEKVIFGKVLFKD